MQVIVFKNDLGGVSVCYPTGELPIETVLTKDCPPNSQARIVENESLPLDDNDFFEAWEMNSTSVTVNLAKAKELTKKRLRIERTDLLQAQDVAFQRALESGLDTTAIVAEKQRLRDITNLADSASSLDELRAINC
jgi:hypothetical protein